MHNLPALLVILDGYARGASEQGNAVAAASTPHLDRLFSEYPDGVLDAAGLAVGLPEGQMGNSEVGHLNIGAGRVVYQELTRIDLAIQDGSLFDNEVLDEAMDGAVSEGKAIHFMGLVSPGGVHSHQEHLYALVEMAARRGAQDVWVHCFLDGRDTPPKSGLSYVQKLEVELERVGVGRVATVMGRYYAMDRDNRWDRVEKAWQALVLGEGVPEDSATQAIESSYEAGVTDEFVVPAIVAPGQVRDGDAVIFFNFRPDRAREITRAFTDPTFVGFDRPVFPQTRFVCLTEYDPTIPAPVAFPKALPVHILADALAENGLKQFHIAETEKYAHVTFFLNGGVETPKQGETRVLVPSPKVPTYDLQPEMSAPQVTERLVQAIANDEADVYIVNYANCDMVGHTGIFEAAVAAVEAVDTSVGALMEAIASKGGSMILTSDHGNAEQMVAEDHETPFTAHTTSKVPFVVMAPGVKEIAEGGILADVAPTLAALVGMQKPDEWTGHSLLVY